MFLPLEHTHTMVNFNDWIENKANAIRIIIIIIIVFRRESIYLHVNLPRKILKIAWNVHFTERTIARHQQRTWAVFWAVIKIFHWQYKFYIVINSLSHSVFLSLRFTFAFYILFDRKLYASISKCWSFS